MHHAGDQTRRNEMRSCVTYGGEYDCLYDLGTDGRIILKQIFSMLIGVGSMDWIDLAQERQVAGSCECGIEPSCSTKCGEFLD
jgi:hypothetical protein